MRSKILIALVVVYLAAVAVWALGPLPGADNYINIGITSGSPRVNIAGANFHVEGTSLFDSTVTLPASTALTSPTLTSPVSTNGTFATPIITTPTVTGLLTNSPQAFSIADDLAGSTPAGTLTPTSGVVLASCLDPHNCTVVMGEVGMVSGMIVTIVGATAATSAFADSAGVSELTGTLTLGIYDSLTLVYATDRWVELGTVNN